ERHRSADRDIRPTETFADGNECSLTGGVEIDQGISAKGLDQSNRKLDTASTAKHDMLGPDAERGRSCPCRLELEREGNFEGRGAKPRAVLSWHDLSGNQIHRGRAEEIRNEIIDRVGIDFHR